MSQSFANASLLPSLLALLTVILLASGGCQAYELPGAIGEQCDLNSDCDAPLICRFGHCRVECDSARDCAAGFDCLLDDQKRGACQLEIDLGCALNSDCTAPLICTMGECTNACACEATTACRDCAPGAACVTADDGSRACLDTSTTGCVYDSDCPSGPPFEICATDSRCRAACIEDEDCRNGEMCVNTTLGDGSMGPLCIFMGRTAP